VGGDLDRPLGHAEPFADGRVALAGAGERALECIEQVGLAGRDVLGPQPRQHLPEQAQRPLAVVKPFRRHGVRGLAAEPRVAGGEIE
jgi:hypothetical protein